MKNCYLYTLIQNNIQQNDLNQSNLVVKETQAVIVDKNSLINNLKSDIEQLQAENLSFKETVIAISSVVDKNQIRWNRKPTKSGSWRMKWLLNFPLWKYS